MFSLMIHIIVYIVLHISNYEVFWLGCKVKYILIKKVLTDLALGAAYGTAKSGTGIAAMAVMRPELIMKSIIPVVMAGIIAIYGLVVAVIISQSLVEPPGYTLFK